MSQFDTDPHDTATSAETLTAILAARTPEAHAHAEVLGEIATTAATFFESHPYFISEQEQRDPQIQEDFREFRAALAGIDQSRYTAAQRFFQALADEIGPHALVLLNATEQRSTQPIDMALIQALRLSLFARQIQDLDSLIKLAGMRLKVIPVRHEDIVAVLTWLIALYTPRIQQSVEGIRTTAAKL